MAVQLLALDPSIVISLNGAVCGFFLIYVIPIGMHLKCIYQDSAKRSLIKEPIDGSTHFENIFVDSISAGNINASSKETLLLEYEECVDHKEQAKDNKYLICAFYCFLGLIGFCIMLAQIGQMIFN